ncbi:EF-hand calcium-binding domain-containing 7-like [Paramuricea clavata]|uniref:EF-hand calcium-binding domain-containing 7-like n=1 Tax=Paramuricea clavata TaxID=317549 RepID=A0A6S7I550_PARCT|nr:EF-hand calcium-binding domain-containing 7-like [Paramuricea clavata]
MSRKSSLASQSSMKLEQEMRECRMAYLSVLSSTSENMTSSKELTLALQYSGRNPTQKSIKKHWKYSTESISYSEFCEIMKQEKQNSKNDLVYAFKKMDINDDGFISFSELKKALTMYGERMSESEVQDILDEADDNGDGRLDYEEFCDLLMSTAERCKELSQKKVKDDVTSREQRSSSLSRKSSSNNVNSVQGKPPKSPRTTGKAVKEPKNLKDWDFQTRKGFVVVEGGGKFSSHCYKLKIPSSTKLWLTIHGNFQDRQMDFTLFVVRADSGELVAFTQAIVDERSCVLTDISPGEYNVLVFTTGCQLSARSFESKRTVELIKTVNGEIELTKRCRDALTEIFLHCDLDGNGYLSRHEFDVFQMRTSGESCDDGAWEVMVENFDTKNGREITLKGFLDLNLMEARDAEGDPNDLWVTFNSMGYNKALEPDQVAFFVTEIYSRDCDIKLQALKIDDNKEILNKAVVQSIVENSTTHNVKRMRDLILHRYDDERRVSLAIENKSRQSVMVRLNCNKSQNCVSHCGNLNCVIKVEARSTEVRITLYTCCII